MAKSTVNVSKVKETEKSQMQKNQMPSKGNQ